MSGLTPTIEIFGKVAGIGGLSIGLAFFVFRDVIAKKIFPMLDRSDAYRLLRLIVILAFIISIAGIIAWANPTLIFGNGNTTVNAGSAKDSTISVVKP